MKPGEVKKLLLESTIEGDTNLNLIKPKPIFISLYCIKCYRNRADELWFGSV